MSVWLRLAPPASFKMNVTTDQSQKSRRGVETLVVRNAEITANCADGRHLFVLGAINEPWTAAQSLRFPLTHANISIERVSISQISSGSKSNQLPLLVKRQEWFQASMEKHRRRR